MKRSFLRSIHAAYTLMLLSILAAIPALAQTPTISFSSRPYDSTTTAASGVVGTAYSYDADATASDNSTVTYSLRYGPSGMTVNSSSGVVSWTPSSRGIYLVEIRASLASDPGISTTQGWAILVAQCGSTTISGSVKDMQGNNINSGTITARVVGTSNSPLPYVTATISNGLYSMTVDEGNYILQATGDKFLEQWYDGAYDFGSAKPVDAPCGQATTANFSVQVPAQLKWGNIHGRIVSSVDNTPIVNADVWLYERSLYLPEKLKWEKVNLANATRTDANGSFTFGASGLMTTSEYIVGYWVHQSGDVPQTYRQYYSLATSPTDATWLRPGTGDHNDVNFLVYPDSNRAALIRGIIQDSADYWQEAWLSALFIERDAEGNPQINPMRSRSQYAHGQIVWLAIDSGEHILAVQPFDHHFAPGYYKSGGGLTQDWQQAMRITPDSTRDPVDQVSIRMFDIRLQRTDSAGISQLRGSVTQTSNSTSKHGSQVLGPAPLANALVIALDSAGRTIAWSYSNEKGDYSLEALGRGEYTIKASKIGYTTQTMKASTSGMGEIIKADMHLQQNFTSSVPVITGTSAHTASATAYPNPVNSTVTLDFDGAAGKAHISIASASGEEVMTREVESIPGKNQTAVDVQSLMSGTYIATIMSGANVATVRFVIVR